MSWQLDPNSGTTQWVNDGGGDPSQGGYDAANTHFGATTGAKKKVPEFGGPTPPKQPQAPTLPPGSPGNGPIFPPDPVQPISFNGGQHFSPTTAPFGFDLSQPGVREQFWNNNQQLWMQSPQLDWVNSQLPQFQDPWFGETWNQKNIGALGQAGAGQQYWNGLVGKGNMMGAAQKTVNQGYHGKNRAADAYGQFKGAMPGSLQPSFDAYYDRMADKAMSNVNSQAAARGVYGSNSALNNSIGAGLDVEAMRAKAGTDFSLADSANQLNWFNGLSGAGRAADLSGTDAFRANIDAARSDLDRTKTLGDLAFRAEEMDFNKKKAQSDAAFGVDEHRQDRLDSGISTAFGLDEHWRGRLNDAYGAAGLAQDARERRVGGLYDDVTGMSRDAVNFLSQKFDQLLDSDGAITEQSIQAALAQAADQMGWDQQTQERIFRDVATALNLKNQSDAAGEAKGKA